ncbi:MAG: formate dehydrogenase accessory sulfurtransferase FdhD [Defluviitaleaceae bacterium]|nr:formate dehydrogenase accessory sulfurtransferase FdhD [Defluviitaleaceae bacterium]
MITEPLNTMIDLEPIVKYDKNGISNIEDPIVKELRANLMINEELYLSMMALPQDFDELAVGFMFAEGLIKSIDDIERIESTCTGNIFVYTKEPIQVNEDDKRVLVSGCGSGSVSMEFLNELNLPQLVGNQTFSYNEIINMMKKFNKQSEIFNKAGGCHSAALRFKDGTDIFFEDIGRHNAVDKVVGKALMEKRSIEDCALLVSGRISSEIVLKTIKLGIPVLISQSGPTAMSLALAKKTNMTLIGFARAFRFNIYSGAFRVTE